MDLKAPLYTNHLKLVQTSPRQRPKLPNAQNDVLSESLLREDCIDTRMGNPVVAKVQHQISRWLEELRVVAGTHTRKADPQNRDSPLC